MVSSRSIVDGLATKGHRGRARPSFGVLCLFVRCGALPASGSYRLLERVLAGFRWGMVTWPLSLLAVIAGLAGKGCGRALLVMAGSALILVWTMAFVH